MSFQIVCDITPAEWAKAKAARQQNAPGSDYDQNAMPHFSLLYSVVQFSDGARDLFIGTGFEISVIDVAHGLIRVLDGSQFAEAPEGFVATFSQADDALTIDFEKKQGQVTLRTNLERSQPLTVPVADFLKGTQQFLEAFGRDLHARAPECLDWESMAQLRPYGA